MPTPFCSFSRPDFKISFLYGSSSNYLYLLRSSACVILGSYSLYLFHQSYKKHLSQKELPQKYTTKQFNIFSVWLHLIHLQSSFMREQRLSLYILIWFLCFLRWLPSNELLEARPKPLGMKVVWKRTLCIMLLRQELLFLRLPMITNHKARYKSHTKMFFGPTILIITAIYDPVRKKSVTITYWYISKIKMWQTLL